MKAKLNKDWHLQHRMPERPTMEERIKWHLEHVKHCGCRSIPPKLVAEIEKRKLA